jgi:hypothetical protein
MEIIMFNPATQSMHKLNVFTQYLVDNPGTKVKLRNGNIVMPVLYLGQENWADDYDKPRGFMGNDWLWDWNLDGSSVTRPDYDMMEIVNDDSRK